MTLKFEDEVQKTLYTDATKKAMRISMIDTATTSGATDNPTLELDMAKVQTTEWTKSQGNDEIVTQDITFKAFYSTADAKIITARLVNTKTSY